VVKREIRLRLPQEPHPASSQLSRPCSQPRISNFGSIITKSEACGVGNQSQNKEVATDCFLTAVGTCKMEDEMASNFFTETIRLHRVGQPSPSLLPQQYRVWTVTNHGQSLRDPSRPRIPYTRPLSLKGNPEFDKLFAAARRK
jgi:hypothetical protein